MKLPQEVAARIMSRDFEAEAVAEMQQDRERHAAFVKVWRDARYATESRKAHFWSREEWFVVDGSPGWSKGPYGSEDAAERERASLDRARLLILHGER